MPSQDRLGQLFAELAAERLPVPAAERVLARGSQRRRRARLTACASVLAVVAVGAGSVSYVKQAADHGERTGQRPAAKHTTSKPTKLRAEKLPPPGRAVLLLGLNANGNFAMARQDNPDLSPVPVRQLAANDGFEPLIATDPAGGWVADVRAGPDNSWPGPPTRLVHVSPSGKVVPFGPGFGRYSVITGMVVNPDSASVAVAILRQDRHWNPRHPEQGRRPGVIVLVGLPGHPPNEGKWILDSSTATQADSLSWRDDTHLTYIPGSDETGGGFAGRGAVTLDVAAASRVAPATSRWPVPSKAPGSCNLVSGTWFEPPGGHVASYLALEACAAGGGDVLVQVNPVTGRQLSRRARVHGFGCPSQPLDPQPGEAIVLVSFCGLQLYQPGSAVQQLHGLSDAAFAG